MTLSTALAWEVYKLIPAAHSPAAVILVIAASFVAVFTVAAGVKVACHLERQWNARNRRHRGEVSGNGA